MLSGYEGSEVPLVIQFILIHKGLKNVRNGIGSRNDKAVDGVFSNGKMRFSFDDFLELQRCPSLFVELDNSKISDINHMWVVDIFDWIPTIRQRLLPCICIGHQNNKENKQLEFHIVLQSF